VISSGKTTAARLVLAFAVMATACTRAPSERVVLQVGTVENALDDSQRVGCSLQDDVEAGTRHEAWISFGDVKPDAERGWEAVRNRLHCERGSSGTSGIRPGGLLGTPYVVLDLELVPSVPRTGTVLLSLSSKLRTLSGFNQDGRPLYEERVEKRTFQFGTRGEALLSVLIANEREKQAFGVHDVLLRVTAIAARNKSPAAYGTVSVTGDVPGAEVLLDGGLVGRLAEGKPTVVNNVVAGTHQIRVRDFSRREARGAVVVEKDRTVEIALPVLPLPSSGGSSSDMVPIGKNPEGYEEYWGLRDGAIIVSVPAGEFTMGSPPNEGEADERPQRRVRLSEFRIDKTEVTWRQFRKFAEATGTPLPPAPIWGAADDYAVSNATWDEAAAYCAWVGGRLPTEAEWEKAARGTDGRRYPWGNDYELGRCSSLEGGPHRPYSVGAFPKCLSPYGVLDMAGNVWEWCADWYGDTYPDEGVSEDPKGPASGTMRVLRGGAWIDQRVYLRTAYRLERLPSMRHFHFGLRCVHGGRE